MDTVPSRCSQTLTRHLAKLKRHLMVQSASGDSRQPRYCHFEPRACCTQKMLSKSLLTARHETRSCFPRLHLHVAIGRKAETVVEYRRWPRPSSGFPPALIRGMPLPGLKHPLYSPTSLGAIARNMFDPQLLQRPSNLRQLTPVQPPRLLWAYKEMTATIRVQTAETPCLIMTSFNPFITVNVPSWVQDRPCRLRWWHRPSPGSDPASGLASRGNQAWVLPPSTSSPPFVAVRLLLPMRPSFPGLRYQPGRLQGALTH